MSSYHIGRRRRSNGVRPYYGMVTSAHRIDDDGGVRSTRWHWHLRRYEDGSTACRGPGQGFASRGEAEADMRQVVTTMSEITADVRDQ